MAPPDFTTWHGFATAIVEAMALPAGRTRPRVAAISSAEYPTPAKRPAWSVLDGRLLRETFGMALPPWRTQLAHCLAEPA
jgi:dTDP-4-dehydrorhamnose reductase